MKAAVRNGALEMLRRLRTISTTDQNASLTDVLGRGPFDGAAKVAYEELFGAGFYRARRCKTMVSAIDRAIKRLETGK